jgi:putative CocE/NonD family hydrolase
MTGKKGTNADLASSITGYDHPTDVIVEGGYIRVVQDVRGKYGSEGHLHDEPAAARHRWNPTHTDDSTDTYDTIDWLVKNLPESNQKVGILGISYDGFLSLMPLINPHPALKVAVPMNPMVDGWRGDDWFHNGAFRQPNLVYIWEQVATKDNSSPWFATRMTSMCAWMKAGSAGAMAASHGLDQIGFWKKIAQHPAYDTFWQDQALDKVLAGQPLKVPTMLVHGLWDQEDIYGAQAVYRALKPKDVKGDMVYLSMGPWYHGQQIDEGSALGDIKWDMETSKWWRRHVLAPSSPIT